MLIFEAQYHSEFINIPSEAFASYDGSSREAFFSMIEEEGKALAARVKLRATGHIIEVRNYGE